MYFLAKGMELKWGLHAVSSARTNAECVCVCVCVLGSIHLRMHHWILVHGSCCSIVRFEYFHTSKHRNNVGNLYRIEWGNRDCFALFALESTQVECALESRILRNQNLVFTPKCACPGIYSLLKLFDINGSMNPLSYLFRECVCVCACICSAYRNLFAQEPFRFF